MNLSPVQHGGESDQLIRIQDQVCGKVAQLNLLQVRNAGETEQSIPVSDQMEIFPDQT